MRKVLGSSLACLLVLVIFTGGNVNAEAASLLENGSSGQDVYDVQAKLSRMGYLNTNPTGYYGSLTERAVKDFQYERSLTVDGVVGNNVRNHIDNIAIMARVVHGEARGETYQGKVAVAAVILNRKQSSQFPNTVHNVTFQQNAFTAIQDHQYYLTPTKSDYDAVVDALNGVDPTQGSTYYYNPNKVTDQWIFTRDPVTRIGSHTFAH